MKKYFTNIALALVICLSCSNSSNCMQKKKKTQPSTIEQATQLLANTGTCKKAYAALLKYKPAGVRESISNKHLQSNKQEFKGYFSADTAENVLDTLLPAANCAPDSAKYIHETNVVECHLKCDNNIGYDVNLDNHEKQTKNILLVYSANATTGKWHQTFLVEAYPRENP